MISYGELKKCMGEYDQHKGYGRYLVDSPQIALLKKFIKKKGFKWDSDSVYYNDFYQSISYNERYHFRKEWVEGDNAGAKYIFKPWINRLNHKKREEIYWSCEYDFDRVITFRPRHYVSSLSKGVRKGVEGTVTFLTRPDKTINDIYQAGKQLWDDPIGTVKQAAHHIYKHPLETGAQAGTSYALGHGIVHGVAHLPHSATFSNAVNTVANKIPEPIKDVGEKLYEMMPEGTSHVVHETVHYGHINHTGSEIIHDSSHHNHTTNSNNYQTTTNSKQNMTNNVNLGSSQQTFFNSFSFLKNSINSIAFANNVSPSVQWQNFGCVYLSTNNPNSNNYMYARLCFEECLRLDPNNPYAYYNLGLIYKFGWGVCVNPLAAYDCFRKSKLAYDSGNYCDYQFKDKIDREINPVQYPVIISR